MSQQKSVRNLLNEYGKFEETLPIYAADDTTSALSVFNGNKSMPVHRWFTFKEGFSSRLLDWLTSSFALDLPTFQVIFDPFCGVATSLLSAQLALIGSPSTHLIGIERNPFIKFVAQAKLNWFNYDIEEARSFIPRLLLPLTAQELRTSQIPSLSTFHNPQAFRISTLQQLLAYRTRIERICPSPLRDFFLLGWCAIIERVSGLRRDGRALRFIEKSNVPTVCEALRTQWYLMIEDLQRLVTLSSSVNVPQATIIEGDGRCPDDALPGNESVDLIIYSPPYLNNIDYTEVYKLELWLAGFVDSQQGFKQQRLKTLRSHPSVRFPETRILDSQESGSVAHQLEKALLNAIPDNGDRNWRERLFKGYIDDMLQALLNQFAIAKPGAFVVCVVGNSMHGQRQKPIIVATDLLIASLANLSGFEIKRLQICRQLRRRDHENQLLRETIVVLRKPL